MVYYNCIPNTFPMQTPLNLSHSCQGKKSSVKVELNNHDLWQKFYKSQTEMIITKSGRHMFPKPEFNVTGLDPKGEYFVVVELRLASDKRHKFIPKPETEDGYWIEYSRADLEAHIYNRFFVHSHEPIEGSELMDKMVNFKNLKLTNNPNQANTSIVLQSMHKYIPRLWILKFDRHYFAQNRLQPDILNLFYICEKEFFEFDVTEFIAVTAYQNKKITKLKVDNNPFAKGFRETDTGKRKRKASVESEPEELESSPEQKKSKKQIAPSLNQLTQSIFRPWLSASSPGQESTSPTKNHEFDYMTKHLPWQYHHSLAMQLSA